MLRKYSFLIVGVILLSCSAVVSFDDESNNSQTEDSCNLETIFWDNHQDPCDEGSVCVPHTIEAGSFFCDQRANGDYYSTCDSDQDCLQGSFCSLDQMGIKVCRPFCLDYNQENNHLTCPDENTFCHSAPNSGSSLEYCTETTRCDPIFTLESINNECGDSSGDTFCYLIQNSQEKETVCAQEGSKESGQTCNYSTDCLKGYFCLWNLENEQAQSGICLKLCRPSKVTHNGCDLLSDHKCVKIEEAEDAGFCIHK
ncbi:MAG: hypothetical protein ACQES9_09720 [Myxococcota bacterium]